MRLIEKLRSDASTPSARRLGRAWLFVVLLAVTACFAIYPVTAEDIWWHLKAGELIWSEGRIPDADTFLHTVPEGTPWRSTQWLFQAAWYALYRIGGWNALIVARATMALALVAFAWKWVRSMGHSAGTAFFALLVFHFLARIRFLDRPEMVSFLCFAGQLWLLQSPRLSARSRMGAYAAIQLLWANSHSSVVLGVIAPATKAGCLLAEVAFRKARGMAGNDEAKVQGIEAAWLAVVAVAVSPVAPAGIGMLTYGWTESAKKDIIEFQPGWRVGLMNIAGFAALVCAVGAVRIRGLHRWWLRALCLLAMVQYARMVRALPYWALMGLPLMAASFAWPEAPGRGRRWAASAWRAACLAVVGWVAYVAFLVNSPRLLRWGVDDSAWPVAAADFVIRENVQGNLYNTFNDGSYLVWRLVPRRRVFVFNETLMNEAIRNEERKAGSPADFRDMLDRHGVACAILDCDRRPKASASMIDVFLGWPDWVPVFWDDRAMVLVRRIPGNEELIDRFACVVQPESIPSRGNHRADVDAFLALRSDPETWQQVRAELERLEGESEAHFKASFALGLWHEANGDDPLRARQACERAAEVDPIFPELLERLER